MKGSGGCIGLTENPVAFRRWMLSGPELVRPQQQFEVEYLFESDPDNPGKTMSRVLQHKRDFSSRFIACIYNHQEYGKFISG